MINISIYILHLSFLSGSEPTTNASMKFRNVMGYRMIETNQQSDALSFHVCPGGEEVEYIKETIHKPHLNPFNSGQNQNPHTKCFATRR
jgi:hypothetical protein